MTTLADLSLPDAPLTYEDEDQLVPDTVAPHIVEVIVTSSLADLARLELVSVYLLGMGYDLHLRLVENVEDECDDDILVGIAPIPEVTSLEELLPEVLPPSPYPGTNRRSMATDLAMRRLAIPEDEAWDEEVPTEVYAIAQEWLALQQRRRA